MAIAINTSQNVLLEYEPASIGERMLATAIDYVVFLAWLILTVVLPNRLLGGIQTDTLGIVYYTTVVGLPILLYNFLCEWLLNGQSLGKIALKIRVVMLDGSPPGVGAYLMRWLFGPIENIFFLFGLVPIICVAVGSKGQRLGDMAAGTTVIHLKPNVHLSDITYAPLPDDYRVTFPEITQLSDQDMQVVREVLRRGTAETILRTADRIKEVLSIDSSLDSYQLLNVFVNDYQYLAMQD